MDVIFFFNNEQIWVAINVKRSVKAFRNSFESFIYLKSIWKVKVVVFSNFLKNKELHNFLFVFFSIRGFVASNWPIDLWLQLSLISITLLLLLILFFFSITIVLVTNGFLCLRGIVLAWIDCSIESHFEHWARLCRFLLNMGWVWLWRFNRLCSFSLSRFDRRLLLSKPSCKSRDCPRLISICHICNN